jgi:AbrB family looped-hinge helix DNA binding protein
MENIEGVEKMPFKMSNYKSVVQVDKQGRMIIPIKVRKDLGVTEGDTFYLEYQDGIITLTPLYNSKDLLNK